ncbi:collagen-like triple helix repeat-containing protein [Hyalangium gracile]|uniref:collagen-like triple helix repeat-containing protein n=1 Tax=Hyalangium gracile TaxID=394092 RepID=UPI0021E16F78|nr:collagen-like protein [Hyalangium gracile]
MDTQSRAVQWTRWALLGALAWSSAGCSAVLGALAAKDAQEARDRQAAAQASAEAQQLSAKDVEAIELATTDGSTTYCQGGKPPALRLVLTGKGNRHEGAQDGKGLQYFKMVQWSASLGTISEGGEWSFVADTAKAAQQPVVITATAVDKPTVTAQLTLTPDFKCERVANFQGEEGQQGKQGQQGAFAQISSSTQRNGGNGGMGGPGGPGGPGKDALPVEVALTYVKHPEQGQLVLVRVKQVGGSRKAYYVLDPAGPPLTVDVSGGRGGQGGFGGSGNMGYQGYSESTSGECCNGNGGDGGDGGSGGPGGTGGKGGAVTVKFDGKQAALKERVRIVNGPGAAGPGGYGGGAGHPGSGGNGAQGARGQDGRFGNSGPSGSEGHPGVAGPPPQFVKASQLFAKDEL